MRQGLYPLRIDASSSDGTVRLIDTLLLDPTCLPHPLLPTAPSSSSSAGTPSSGGSGYETAIESNVRTLTDTLLTDLEVQGVKDDIRSESARERLGYLSQVNSGRRELVERRGLRVRVEAQVRRGLWRLVDADGVWYGGRSSGRGGAGGRDSTGSKRAAEEEKEEDGEEPDAKRRKLDGGETGTTTAPPTTAAPTDEESKDATSPAAAAVASAPPPTEADAGAGPSPSNLVRVHVRLRDGSVTVVDEFDVDPTLAVRPPDPSSPRGGASGGVPSSGDPFALAQSLVDDLNLPRSGKLAVSIATTIIEQLHGLEVEGDLAGMDGTASRRARRDRPAAWIGE